MPGVRLSRCERDELGVGLARGESIRGIARRLGRDHSVLVREVARNGGREVYRPGSAEARAVECARRPRDRLLQADPVLACRIYGLLKKHWSPAPIAAHLKSLGYQVCAETIYRELYHPDSVLAWGWKLLFRRRPTMLRRRKTRTGVDSRPLGEIRLVTDLDPGQVTIPGYWEGDLLVGSRSLSASVVLVERTTKKVLIGALRSQSADEVCAKVAQLLKTVPPHMRRILVWDQGRELARWKTIQVMAGVGVFFCQPASPRQKPLVENTCGLLRRWLPRNQDLYQTQHALNRTARLLNTMPRRSLAWKTADQAYKASGATTM